MAKKSDKSDDKKKLPMGFREHKDGLQYRFVVDGKRYSVYGKTTKECREKEQKKREEIKEKIYRNGKGLKVEEYLDRWIESRELVIKSATMRTYKKLIRRISNTPIDAAGTRFGALKLVELETQNVRDLQKAFLKKQVYKDSKGKNVTLRKLTTRTANDCISLLKKALEAAKNERLISWNPCDPVERLKRTEDQARDNIHRALSNEELEAFKKAAAESHYYNFYLFLLYTGMRIGEAAALTSADITGDVISIHKTVTRTEYGYEIAEQTKTDAGRRTVPLRPEARQALEAQKLNNRMLAADNVIDMKAPIFRMPKGGIIRPDRVNSDIKSICDKAKIEKFTAHAFRATFTSRCVADGVPVKELMEILGHTDVEMTLGLYAHSNEELKKSKLLAVNF